MTFEEAIRGKKAALVDMDGVLYDSMPYHCLAWHLTMLEEGLDIPPKEFFLYEGMTGSATINLLMKREKNVELGEEECRAIYARKSARFKAMYKPNPMFAIEEKLVGFHLAGLRTVLVTGSAQSTLLDRLDVDFPGFFPPEMRVTALDVTRGKPHPEPYLRGLEKAGVTADEAVVLENAPLGVRSAKAAGIFTIAWMTGPIPRERFVEEGADLILPGGISLGLKVGKMREPGQS